MGLPVRSIAVLLIALPALGTACRCVGGEASARGPVPQGRPCDCSAHPLAAELHRLAGEAGAADPGPAVEGGTVVIHLDAEPPHLQPLVRSDAWIRRITGNVVFEGLVRRDPWTREIVPALAERWEWSDDGSTLRFHLRPGVAFHDGRPLRAQDVEFTFARLFDPSVMAESLRSDLEMVRSVRAAGPGVVEMRIDRPYFLLLETIGFVPILPEHVYATGDLNRHPANRAPVGTGPFRFERWETGEEIVLRRAEGYWGRPARLDRVVFKVVRDRTVAFQMMRRGDIDLIPRITPDQAEEYLADGGFRERAAPVPFQPPDFAFWVYNTRRPPFDDARVRRAMTMLIDREAIRCSLERCLAVVRGQPWPPGHPAEDPVIRPWPFDPAAALALLAEAGWTDADGDGRLEKAGSPLRFTFLVAAQSKVLQQAATIVQQDLAAAGIVMDIAILDWSVFSERTRKHEFDVASVSWSLRWENDFHGVFSAEGAQNYGQWRHLEADRIVREARSILDDGARNAEFRKLSAILHAEQPYTFTFSYLVVSLVSRRVVGARPSFEWFQLGEMGVRSGAGP